METNQSGEYITFRVARQDFAMLTSRVRGILAAQEVIPLDDSQFPDGGPNPGVICGFASLRGRDLPVVDLRSKLGIARGSHGRQPCVVVVEIGTAAGPALLGFVADRISEVVKLRDRDFRNGSVRVNGRARRVLDPDSILSAEELASYWSPLVLLSAKRQS